MQGLDLARAIGAAINTEQGAMQADGCGVFHGEAHGLGGGAETARTHGAGRGDIAPQEQVSGGVKNMGSQGKCLSAGKPGGFSALGAGGGNRARRKARGSPFPQICRRRIRSPVP